MVPRRFLTTSLRSAESQRFATFLFFVLVIATIPTAILIGRERWFTADEWFFLSERSLDVDGLLREHSGHWVTLPFLVFRATFRVFGLHIYLPYELQVVLTHAAVAVLGYLVSRRMAVNAWLAAAVSSCLLLFGAGALNILFAFQITVNGSLVCGYVYLLLVVHDGPCDKRNVAGVGVAILGLMTSAVMVPMIIGVAAALMARRGWRSALFHTALPAGVFLLWYVGYGTSQPGRRGSLSQTAEMVVRLTTETLEALGQNRILAAILGAVIVIGIWGAYQQARSERRADALAFPAALICAWLSFSIVAAIGRAGELPLDSGLPGSERYVYVGAALLLPLVAYGGSRLSRIRPFLALVPIIALALGVPGNVETLVKRGPEGDRDIILAVAYSELLDRAPAHHRPLQDLYMFTSVGWLRSARANGYLPDPGALAPADQLDADARVALAQIKTADVSCVPEEGPLAFTAQVGDIIHFSQPIKVTLTDGAFESQPIRRSPWFGPIVIQAGPVNIKVSGTSGTDPVVCVSRTTGRPIQQ